MQIHRIEISIQCLKRRLIKLRKQIKGFSKLSLGNTLIFMLEEHDCFYMISFSFRLFNIIDLLRPTFIIFMQLKVILIVKVNMKLIIHAFAYEYYKFFRKPN